MTILQSIVAVFQSVYPDSYFSYSRKGVSMSRCAWVNPNNPLYIAYHDEEWGKPLHDEQSLFELLCLESYQAGLSWEIVLNKRQAFRSAFFNYDIQKVAAMTDSELDSLLTNPDIIRHKAKRTLPAPMLRPFFEYRRNSVRLIRIFGNGLTLHLSTTLSSPSENCRPRTTCLSGFQKI